MLKVVFLFAFTFLSISLFAQKNVIVTIGDHQFTKDEYEQIYRKNNTQLNDENEIKTPTEYLELFIDYKLKVIEAESRGLDTIKAFIDEFAGYREELAKPYLTDITVTDSMVKQAYYRTINQVKASHILIQVPSGASPEDTLNAYHKIIDIRNKFINKEKTFEELAYEYSDDPSAKQNNGDLGFFSAFNMITSFENAAYETPVGEVSMPVATQYGYHIIYVTDKQSIDSEIKVAHIMKIFKDRENTQAEEIQYTKQLDSLITELNNGADFSKLAKENSDDKGTSQKGGEMGWLNKGFRINSFIDAGYSLKNIGDISKPIRTPYGMHIIKLIDIRDVQPFEELKNELSRKVKNDPDRSIHSKLSFINKNKRDLGFVEYNDNISTFRNYIRNAGDSIFVGMSPEFMSMPLYKIADSIYTIKKFYELQLKKKTNENENFISSIVEYNLDVYNEDIIIEYVKSKLEILHPEFAQIMQEYRDGMLLFSIMQEEVWDKAVQDSIGLQAYYEANKNKYLWDDHFSGLLIKCNNQEALDTCKKLLDEGIVDPVVITERINVNNIKNIKITKDKWEKGDNDRIDYFQFGGPEPARFNAEFEFVVGEMVKAGSPKKLEEAKGLYISDYQGVLEEQWIKSLRNKYKVKANKKLLKSIESL